MSRVSDERAAFETWADKYGHDLSRRPIGREGDASYISEHAHYAWTAWQSRAALEAAMGVGEQAGEAQELDFYREHIGNDLDNLLIGAGVMQVTHEGGYEACWKNTIEAVERLAALAARKPLGQEGYILIQRTDAVRLCKYVTHSPASALSARRVEALLGASTIADALPPADLRAKVGEGGVDRLAQIIRKVDGNHSLGAGALAEAIIAEWMKRSR